MVHPSIIEISCEPVKQVDHFKLLVKFRDNSTIDKTLETSELRELIGVVDNAIGSEVKKKSSK